MTFIIVVVVSGVTVAITFYALKWALSFVGRSKDKYTKELLVGHLGILVSQRARIGEIFVDARYDRSFKVEHTCRCAVCGETMYIVGSIGELLLLQAFLVVTGSIWFALIARQTTLKLEWARK